MKKIKNLNFFFYKWISTNIFVGIVQKSSITVFCKKKIACLTIFFSFSDIQCGM